MEKIIMSCVYIFCAIIFIVGISGICAAIAIAGRVDEEARNERVRNSD